MIGTIATARDYVGRFAPSPTGRLHLGSLLGAVVSFLDARCHGGRWLVRIEDIDPPREVAGAAHDILTSLSAHGLIWDGEIQFQRHSLDQHEAAIRQLIDGGHAYYCQCSRKRLIADGHQHCYPGLCRDAGHTEGALRVRVDNMPIQIQDRWQAPLNQVLSESPGDFIIRRRDNLIAYQLAVVIDDATSGITDVVRGVDIYDSTPRQAWLQQLLGLPQPRYAHFPVIVDELGVKLSKQTGAAELENANALGNLRAVLAMIGLPTAELPRSALPEQVLKWAVTQYHDQLLKSRANFISGANHAPIG